MTELVVLRGLPASGKTTWARAWVANDPARYARVSRDDLRGQLFGATEGDAYRAYFDLDGLAAREAAVTAAEDAMVRGLLEAGRSVVVDNTHLRVRYIRHWAEVAAEHGASARIQSFLDVPLDECLRRDAARGDRVGRGVILDMHRKFGPRFARDEAQDVVDAAMHRDVSSTALAFDQIEAWVCENGHHGLSIVTIDGTCSVCGSGMKPAGKPGCWIVDVDGTLAMMNQRSPYDYTRVGEDDVNEAVARLVRQLSEGSDIVVVSGRKGTPECRAATIEWLERHEIPQDDLFMRAPDDDRSDEIVKEEILRRYVAPYWNVLGVIDDRNRVVRMWRRLGLLCLQVAPGAF